MRINFGASLKKGQFQIRRNYQQKMSLCKIFLFIYGHINRFIKILLIINTLHNSLKTSNSTSWIPVVSVSNSSDNILNNDMRSFNKGQFSLYNQLPNTKLAIGCVKWRFRVFKSSCHSHPGLSGIHLKQFVKIVFFLIRAVKIDISE